MEKERGHGQSVTACNRIKEICRWQLKKIDRNNYNMYNRAESPAKELQKPSIPEAPVPTVVKIGKDTQSSVFPGKAKFPKCEAMGRKGHHYEHLLIPSRSCGAAASSTVPHWKVLQNKRASVGQ